MSARSGKLAATAREFTPAPTAVNKVLDASFISQTIPDISAKAGIIGLCAVPQERAGADDLGWHIADFLAFKSLLCGENNPRSQTWLAQCDVASLVKAYPGHYTHGKDRRVVSGAAESLTYANKGKIIDREDNIQVEPSAEELKAIFIEAINGKAHTAKAFGFPLVIIICSLTSLEQDVFFPGKTNVEFRLTSGELRHVLGDSIDVIVITPALFSAGWQINPSFCSSEVKDVRVDRTDFLARQFGGIFTKDLVEQFISWKCPILDGIQVNEGVRTRERYPGPVMPTDQQQSLIDTLKIKINSYLLGRCSLHHYDHSFHFDKESDDWEKLIRPRAHKQLGEYKKKWESLGVGTAPNDNTALPFLGNAFGGTRQSQLRHIKHLIQESFTAWPGYWNMSFGRLTMEDFKKFVKINDSLTCHEFFNALEHRATLTTFADMMVRYFSLPFPDNVRCRDWDQSQRRTRSSDEQERLLLQPYQEFCKILPAPNLPPGVNLNYLSRIQKRHDTPTFYLTASLGVRFGMAAQQIQAAVDRIKDRMYI
ncbi:hypothetical protein F5X99DRAFT_188128 [Biscogniauxia marginata]|nr:hypothetical protein F5X99DRAFT_188128 [Biscogniauxia marginata]